MFDMKEEVKKILKMVEEKKITAEEGEKLIDALDDNVPAVYENGNANTAPAEPKFLRVHVIDEDDKVDINVPLSLVEVGLKMGTQFAGKDSDAADKLKDIDFKGIMEAIKQGARGKIVDVKTQDSIVEVYVE
jgi:hypothetical protein